MYKIFKILLEYVVKKKKVRKLLLGEKNQDRVLIRHEPGDERTDDD